MEEKRGRDLIDQMNAQNDEFDFSRRKFLGVAAAAGVVVAACSQAEKTPVTRSVTKMVPGPDIAPDGPVLKAGLIGCGGRGTGAAGDFLDAGPSLQIAALADVFDDQLQRCRARLKEDRGVEVADDHCFVGFDAHTKLLETDVDIVILATPPHFRPEQFEAAVQARKHVFMEKPVAVDPVGVRSVMATAEKAEALDLVVVTGTQYRHQKSFIETYNRVLDGAIGQVVGARGYSLRGQLWYKEPREEWTDMEDMLRDWVNWQWLSGDHIVEQHIHGLDVMFWFTEQHPIKGVAVGGRARRVTGDQYDFFSVDYELGNGAHINSMCRQVDGCTNNISRFVLGTEGYTDCSNTIYNYNNEVVWSYDEENDNSPYVQEHIDLVTTLRKGEKFNEAVETAKSTMAAIMARDSAYTGLEITMDELMKSDQRLGPTVYELGGVEGLVAEAPVPGTQKEA
ncbi:MAG TPA: Gfo/Idh/MocA family oxidoreductase [Acidobacteriota bacterium]|nr:Gfo/Idh/MocA family oxidoreductase [Acidobacteriota bacterium]